MVWCDMILYHDRVPVSSVENQKTHFTSQRLSACLVCISVGNDHSTSNDIKTRPDKETPSSRWKGYLPMLIPVKMGTGVIRRRLPEMAPAQYLETPRMHAIPLHPFRTRSQTPVQDVD